MEYSERLQKMSVIGAAGKMGSGILLLTAIEMADTSLLPENKNKHFVLNAIDVCSECLTGLMEYVKVQATKIAEKKLGLLRQLYADRADLIENFDIIDQYVWDVLKIIRPSTRLEATYDSNIVFEAVIENPTLKTKLLSQVKQNASENTWFFSNTSSIPIAELDKSAGLDGKLIGFHFYNPPAIQKLVELIKGENSVDGLEEFAIEYAKKLGKIVVPSNDFAGFIGNGHFMRDAIHGILETQNLAKEMPYTQALYAINSVSQNFLVRPMGIFQLIDYVGIDVCKYIMSVMNPYLPDEDLHSDLLDQMMELNVKGGQNSDGSQKDGFLKYEKGRPVAIFDIETKKYVNIDSFSKDVDQKLGKLPQNSIAWKQTLRMKDKFDKLAIMFDEMMQMNTLGAEIAKKYMENSRQIGIKLVNMNVAKNADDVNTVLMTGFFHAYGPINDYLKK
ncbi:MAG: 3-hydroxyacyl-CoA dehydrogenase family protein [Bacteroidales bacterium]|nr:3-hydroxyacyl-CoA dehydrogenase family protein [Bacteroidales bacterium]